MRFPVLLISCFLAAALHAQRDYFYNGTDTIRLPAFASPGPVAYQCDQVTFYLDRKGFADTLQKLLFDYRNYPKWIYRGPGHARYRKDLNRSIDILEGMIREINQRSSGTDTVYLADKLLSEITLREWDLRRYIANQIELRNCAIAGKNGQLHLQIIRVSGPWGPMPGANEGGRRYYLPGADMYFIDVMDWIR